MKQLGLDADSILLYMKIYWKLFQSFLLPQQGKQLLNGRFKSTLPYISHTHSHRKPVKELEKIGLNLT